MKKLITVILASLGIALMLMSCSRAKDKESFQDNLQWWQEARYGMFIHWGISSLEGFEISWPRPSFGAARYDSLALKFNPYKFDADKWVEAAQKAGMKYMVLTAKHHDGFCLWDTKTQDHNIMNTPYGKDVCAQLADAAHSHGMRLGWYFSCRQWNDDDCSSPVSNEVYVEKMKAQLKELLTNYGDIDLLWFDYEGYPCPANPQEIFDYVLSIDPDIIMNNRLYPLTPDESHAYVGSCGMYATPEQFVGGYGEVPWETCSTSSTSRQWAIRYNDPPRPAEELIWETIGAAGGNGNMLMNVGPDSLGVILPAYVDRLAEVGAWIEAHEGILYGTSCGPWKPCSEYVSTVKGKLAYLLLKEGGPITLPFSRSIRIASASIEGAPVEFTAGKDSISFSVPSEYVGKPNVAIRLELSKALGRNFKPLSPAGTSGSVAYGKPSKASSSLSDVYMHCPSSAFDDNWGTSWRPGRNCSLEDNDIYGRYVHYTDPETGKYFNDDAVLEVDLQKALSISSFSVMPKDDRKDVDFNTGRFRIEYRHHGVWIVAAHTNCINEEWCGEFEPVKARHWRLVIEDGSNGRWGYGIREFRLF